MKKIINNLLKNYMLKNEEFIPIYTGENLIAFQYRKIER